MSVAIRYRDPAILASLFSEVMFWRPSPGPQTDERTGVGVLEDLIEWGVEHVRDLERHLERRGVPGGASPVPHEPHELEHLVTALEAVPDGEGTPMPPLTGS